MSDRRPRRARGAPLADGRVSLGGRELGPGDAAWFTEDGGRALIVERPTVLVAWSQGR